MGIILLGVTSGVGAEVDLASKAMRVSLYDAAGRAVAIGSKATYFASGSFTPPATPTDLVTIYGSATKTVRVLSMRIGTTNTAAGSQQFALLRRSAVNTTGTFVAATAVPAEAADVATATVGHYTTNPGALGALVGNINIKRVSSPAAIPASFAGVSQDTTVGMLDFLDGKPDFLEYPVLTAVSQGLAINFNSVAIVAGQTHTYTICWTEE